MTSYSTKRPCIGLSGNFNGEAHLLAKAYVNAVLQAGGTPLILPPNREEDVVEKMLDVVDALLFTGGGDFTADVLGEALHPSVSGLNPERDAFEMPLIKKALQRQLPILGICRGEQLINIAMGGSLYQDIPSQTVNPLPHSQQISRDSCSHQVLLQEGTLLSHLLGEERQAVNSFHHQAIKSIGKGLRIAAIGTDGIIEAVESDEGKPIIGVQWHPECLTESRPVMKKLFEWLTKEAQIHHQAKTLQEQSICVDSHCDTPLFFEGHYDLLQGGWIERGKIDFDAQGDECFERVDARTDLQKMMDGAWQSCIMVAYIKQRQRDTAGCLAAYQKAERILTQIKQQVTTYSKHVGLARSPQDILRLKQEGKRAILLGIENGYALGKDLQAVDHFADMGIVYLTLSHNGHNDVCDSASKQAEPEHHGLSAFGREVIPALNRRGVMVDLSHASEKSFYDALECSRAPIIASHSSSRALCDHPRNLSDDQIKALAAKGGMAGICLYSGFLAKGREATVRDIVSHINHFRLLAGIDCIGIGSDFDGGGGLSGCNHSGELINITKALVAEGYSSADIQKILGGNWLRVMGHIQSLASLV